jgi:CHAT domain-containing protein
VVSGPQATKGKIRDTLPDYRFVQLATHGYIAAESVTVAGPFHLDAPSPELAGRIGRVEVRGLYPGLLASLAWAEVNAPTQEPITGVLDVGAGVMTAEELEGLDLAGCQLAVLSSRDTGRGKVAGGQGVMSLQRAFHQAGVRTVIASLWHVDDTSAQKLMTRLYANLWEKHLPTVKALHQAQLTLLKKVVGDGTLP